MINLTGAFRGIILMMLLLASNSLLSQIASNGTTTTWTTGSGWVGGTDPDPTYHDGSHDADVSHDKTYSGTMTFTNNNTITVKTGATLTVSGNLVIGNNGDLVIEAGATLIVTGNISYTSNGSLVSYGTVNVTGSITVSNGGTLSVDGVTTANSVTVTGAGTDFSNVGGTLDVTNDMTLNGNGTYNFVGTTTIGGDLDMDGASTVANVTGSVAITGELNVQTNSYVQGTGYVSWTTAYVNGFGASYVKCNDGTKKETESTGGVYEDLTGTSIDLTSCEECPSLVPGTIGTAQTICNGTTPTGLTSVADASGGNDSYTYQWRSSTDGSTYSDIASETSTTYSPGSLTEDTWYVRQVTSCSTNQIETTAAIKITVYDVVTPGAIGSDQTICYNTSPVTLTNETSPGGGDASYDYQWRISTDGSAYSDISGATSATYSPGALTANTWYKRKVTSCSTNKWSGAVSITVYDNLVAGSIGSSQSICYNTAPATLTDDSSPTGGTTSYTYQWQSSLDNSSFSDIGGATVATYTPGALTTDTWYRRAETSGSCGTVYTTSVKMTVYSDLSAGVIGSDQSVVYGNSPGLLTEETAASGGTSSYTYQWQSSTDGSSFSDIGSATSSTYSPGAITSDTWYRRAVTSGSCGTVYSASVAMTISVRVCSGETPPAISESSAPSGGTGSFTYQWQSSTDGSSFSDIGGATSATYNPTAVSQTTWYRRAVSSGSCGPVYSSAIKSSVGATPGGISSNIIVWLRADVGTDNIGTQWEDQSGNDNHYTTVTGPSVISSDENFQPAVEILSGGFNAPSGAELGTNWTMFFVSKLLASDSDGRLFDGDSDDLAFGYSGGYRNSIYVDGTPDNKTSGIASSSGVEEIHLFSYRRDNSAGTIEARTDGETLTTFSSTNSGSGAKIDINQGSKSGSESSDSRVHEVVIYNASLTDAEMKKIETYLALKYGIALNDDAGGTVGDYTSVDGTTFWDASNSTSHSNHVIGIGADCGITQKQSATEDDSLRVFVSTLAASNDANGGTITNDESYIMIGHDGGKLKATVASNANLPDGIVARIEREWKVTNTNFSDDYSIEIEWDSIGNVTLSDLRLLVDDDGDFSDATIYSTSDGLTFSFGSIIIGGLGTSHIPLGTSKFITFGSVNAATPLPVELVEFEAVRLGNYIQLKWLTSSEVNNDYFIVEKSSDGINWNAIGHVLGAGNSQEVIKYTFDDFELCDGNCYYRLRQVDFDRKEEISNVITISDAVNKAVIFNVFPNPVKDEFTVGVTTNYPGMYTVNIYSTSGQQMYNSKLVCNQGVNSFKVKTDFLKPGMYILMVADLNGENANKLSFTKVD